MVKILEFDRYMEDSGERLVCEKCGVQDNCGTESEEGSLWRMPRPFGTVEWKEQGRLNEDSSNLRWVRT